MKSKMGIFVMTLALGYWVGREAPVINTQDLQQRTPAQNHTPVTPLTSKQQNTAQPSKARDATLDDNAFARAFGETELGKSWLQFTLIHSTCRSAEGDHAERCAELMQKTEESPRESFDVLSGVLRQNSLTLGSEQRQFLLQRAVRIESIAQRDRVALLESQLSRGEDVGTAVVALRTLMDLEDDADHVQRSLRTALQSPSWNIESKREILTLMQERFPRQGNALLQELDI